MKCPECGYNQKFSNGMICGKCRRKFSLNPKTQISDGKFVATIRRASYDSTVVFTENQLYAAYAKGVLNPWAFFAFGGVFLLVLALFVGATNDVQTGLLVSVPSLICFAMVFIYEGRTVSPFEFSKWTKQWLEDGRSIEGLLRSPSLDQPPPDWNEDDIFDYGVEQILIVERDLLVDLFVLNNRHAETRTLVIAESGYPNYLTEHVNRLVAQRSDLPIYLLHDATEHGTKMKTRLRASSWLNEANNPMLDLGLNVTDVYRIKRTSNFRRHYPNAGIPADTLLLTPLVGGLTACFANQTTFADELARTASGDGSSIESSFG